MIKYAKIVNDETKEVSIANNITSWLVSQGYSQMDVEQSDITNGWYLIGYAPMKSDADKAKEERQKLNSLSLTKREVFLALYKAKGITPDELKSQIEDPAALIEFEYANEYFRGNPLIDLIGQKLGYSSCELDYLFINKEFSQKEAEND